MEIEYKNPNSVEQPGNIGQSNSLRVSLVETGDGSQTLYSGRFNEHYHSVHGAVQESMHVFIEAGLGKAAESRKSINLLEIGFGTGLNALLSCVKALQEKLLINYTSIEAYPLPVSVWSTLNYHQVIASEKTSDLFYKISSAAWDYPAVIISGFNLIKSVCSLQEAEFTPGHFHLVYFDAFSPAVQPEMWTENVFRKLYESMAPGAILMTYSCKGIVKRALRSSGFTIERLPGPPGKREIIRACKLT